MAGPQDDNEDMSPDAVIARGEVEFAAQHIRRAYRYDMTRLQVLEAISCILPMTGALTVQIGVRAMQPAESAPTN